MEMRWRLRVVLKIIISDSVRTGKDTQGMYFLMSCETTRHVDGVLKAVFENMVVLNCCV